MAVDDVTERPQIPARRPIIRWHGGKWTMGKWINSFLPPHEIYTEAYGGGASVLMQKPVASFEVLNDLDPEAANLYRVLADPRSAWNLERTLFLTPYRLTSYRPNGVLQMSTVQRARRLIARGGMAFSNTPRAGFRGNRMRPDQSFPEDDWYSYPKSVPAFHERLKDVTICNVAAIAIFRTFDTPTTLHYVDPPYLTSTRTAPRHEYSFEMTEADHRELLGVLVELEGMVVLSGYASDLYDELLPGWTRVSRKMVTNGQKKRAECLWINPAAVAAMPPRKATRRKRLRKPVQLKLL